VIGCTPGARHEWHAPSQARWLGLKSELAELRSSRAEQYSLNISLTIEQRALGQRLRARGAVAVRPPNALRMILLGPGGTTAFDLWSCGDAFRLRIPALELHKRGDAKTPPAELATLPIAFLRQWFLRPYSGRLLLADEQGSRHRFVLRDDDGALIDFTREGDRLLWRRTLGADEQAIVAEHEPCGRVSHRDSATGVAIEVECERINYGPPPARAFVDPFDPNEACGGSS
jgi:hypothetical protein